MFGQILTGMPAQRTFGEQIASLVNGFLDSICCFNAVAGDVTPDFEEIALPPMLSPYSCSWFRSSLISSPTNHAPRSLRGHLQYPLERYICRRLSYHDLKIARHDPPVHVDIEQLEIFRGKL
jgi:hypothetical protein